MSSSTITSQLREKLPSDIENQQDKLRTAERTLEELQNVAVAETGRLLMQEVSK